MDRRSFITHSSTAATLLDLPLSAHDLSPNKARPKAIIFDSFSIFDPHPVFRCVTSMFPEKATELMKEWRIRQFEYTWLRSVSGRYIDFMSVTEDALSYAGELLNLSISPAQRKELVDAYYYLETWPEVTKVLEELISAGFRLGVLCNCTPEMLETNAWNCCIDRYFEYMISVNIAQIYKPSPVSYELGVSTFGLHKEEILYVPSAGWDAAGSMQFGYETYWANRMQTPIEQLGPQPDAIAKDLCSLLHYSQRK